MVIFTEKTLRDFIKEHPAAEASMAYWYGTTAAADWRTFKDVKATFNTVADIGNDRYVFDVGGNNYRIIAMIHFKVRMVYIRAVLTHKAYDKISEKELKKL